MVTAAKTVSRVVTHMGIAFAITYLTTGSAAFGGVAALLEPIINVMLLPLHEKTWLNIRGRFATAIARFMAIAAEKTSQTGMHMAVAFAVMYGVTGSVAVGGLVALLEPICNVIVLPFHDRAWNAIQAKISRNNGRLQAASIYS